MNSEAILTLLGELYFTAQKEKTEKEAAEKQWSEVLNTLESVKQESKERNDRINSLESYIAESGLASPSRQDVQEDSG